MTSPDYLFTLPEDEVVAERPMKAGDYVVSRQNAAELIALTERGKIRLMNDQTKADFPRMFDPDKDWNGKTVLFARAGGFGDLLAMTPTIYEIKECWPTCTIKVATHERHAPILAHNPAISKILQWPLSVKEWNAADATVWLDQSIEKQRNNRTMHFVDLVAQECGGVIFPDKRMRYYVTRDEDALAKAKYPRDSKYTARLGVQVHSNARNRTYPIAKLHAALMDLHKQGWEIILFGDEAALRGAGAPGVHVVSGTGIRQSCAILATCDVVLAPDSVMCHVAGALNIPTVALYGPFPAALRTAYHQSVHPIQGHAKCAPCFHHVRRGNHFCNDCPTADKGYCAAMNDIDPKRIVKAIKEIAP